MHLTFLSFWLIIVSIAIDVFPVCLSPIINSLWPLPIGIIESIAIIPVSKGSLTSTLLITPGATLKISLRLVLLSGPFPSIGSPIAFITLPVNWLPTGTEITSPVLSA